MADIVAELPLVPWLTSPLAVIAAALFGAVWGSFFNVCIARIPRGESVVRPGSHCFACGRAIRAWDNVPIVSYIVLRGRCRACGARFSPRYALVEALTALLSVLVYYRFVIATEGPPAVRLARYALYFTFVGALVVLSFIDLDTKQLPDVITLPAAVVLYFAAFAVHEVGWLPRLIGAAVGYGAVRLISDGYYYLTGREGLGHGDGKLLAVMGAVLGIKAIPVVIFMASFVGIAVSVPLLVRARKREAASPPRPPEPTPAAEPSPAPGDAAPSSAQEAEPAPAPTLRHTQVPFGPFLSLSAVVYLIWGDALWSALVQFLGGA